MAGQNSPRNLFVSRYLSQSLSF